MKKVTCICDATIKGVKFIKGCNYEVDYNPFIGIMIYTVYKNLRKTMSLLSFYFLIQRNTAF